MAIEVILPKVDMDMATGRISKWFAESGATVKKGDVLFEIETDKAAMEIDAPASGILRDVLATEGVDIPVGSTVAWIYEENEVYQSAGAKTGPAPPASLAESKPSSIAASESGSVAQSNGNLLRATPLARRLARTLDIDLSLVSGSGPNQRITRADVEAYKHPSAEGAKSAPFAQTYAPPYVSVASTEQTLKLFSEGSYEIVPHSTMRRTIARRLFEAKSTVPHFYLTVDCNIEALLKLRAEVNEGAPVIDGKVDYKLSVNDMVIKAYAMALRDVPDANVSWTEDGILKHRHADIGVAVSIPGGLITPIVRNAEIKTLPAISNEMKDLSARAKDGKLKGEEYQGGTAAVSNLGMFGIREFAAIVNPPHATILAVGAGQRRTVVDGNDNVGVATLMTVTLSADHRAVDGALGAKLIDAFRSFIERPMSLVI